RAWVTQLGDQLRSRADLAPCARSQVTKACRPVSWPSAASRGVALPQEGIAFRSAPRARRYSAIRRWLAAGACLVERLRHIVPSRRRAGVEELLNARHHAERRRVPQPIDLGPALDQQAGHLPTSVAHSVIQRCAACDRGSGCLDVSTASSLPPSILADARPR